MFTNGTSFKASKYGAEAINQHMQQKEVVKDVETKDEFKSQNNSNNSNGLGVAAAATTTVVAGVAAYKNKAKLANLFKKETWQNVGKSVGGFFKKIPNIFKKENIKKVTTPVVNFFKKIPSAFKKENIQKITKPIGNFFSKIGKNLPKLFKKV